MSNARSLSRVLPFLVLMGSASVAFGATPWPPVVLTAQVLPGVGQFAIARSQTGRLSLVYCGADCTTIRYRVLSETGTWSAPETVNTGTGPATADLAIDLDPAGVPHVFWSWGDIHHATRRTGGSWSDVVQVPQSDCPECGPISALRITADGQIHFVTKSGYRFWSDLFYVHGPLDGILVSERIELTGCYMHPEHDGEEIMGLDLAIGSNGVPLFFLGQVCWGGWRSSKLVYRASGQWHERSLTDDWNACVSPNQIAIGATIHTNGCAVYGRLSSPTADVNWAGTWRDWRDDMTIDEQDVPYFSAASAGKVTLGTIAVRWPNFSFASLAVESPPPSCTGETCPTFTSSRVLYDRGQVLVAYLDEDGGLRVKGYAMDALRCSFSGLVGLTVTSVGSGSGTVTREPAGTACGADTWGYFWGTAVTLTPAPGTDSAFRTWSGDCA